MRFGIRHNYFPDAAPGTFTDTDAPDWLTGMNTIKGSTMDMRWFWNDHVLTLEVGESIATDFETIIRLE
jgi:hypothetical protein